MRALSQESNTSAVASCTLAQIRDTIQTYWGYRSFRPLQEQAISAVLGGRDSLVVLPTGGGKSLCYQAPAVATGRMTVVVSPLIALMKDQVDGLRACGVHAARIDSSQSPEERSANEGALVGGRVSLLFVSPERLQIASFQQLLQRCHVSTFAIDEAHCISHWGHDFRPEYRQLTSVRDRFPAASVHAYTATATERVRHDIIDQLRLRDPQLLIGNFDRPNLTYRVTARQDMKRQVSQILSRHQREGGIIYCIRRMDVDRITAFLQDKGINAFAYHAGLTAEERKAAQDAFAEEKCDVIVATVAFGMGIDRSNIRFVLHTAMPKSLEHYQQETGRAGRDGLEAECVLLHSGADFLTWKSIINKAGTEAEVDPSYVSSALAHLQEIDRYCRGAVCRHRAIAEYFGQAYAASGCGACDLCLGDTQLVADAAVVSQKILSCVARVRERFGIGHVMAVLRGEMTDMVRRYGHQELSTFGLLSQCPKEDVREWIYQLIGQQMLSQEGEPYPVLRLTAASWEVMRGERSVCLVQPVRRKGPKQSKSQGVSWEGVNRELFEEFRLLRRKLAEERGVPPYLIFPDSTLRELARLRPATLEAMSRVYGVGQMKLADYGPAFLNLIHKWTSRNSRNGGPDPRPGAAR